MNLSIVAATLALRPWTARATLARIDCRMIAMTAARKLATYEDVLNAPEHLVAELVQGVLHTSPRPAPRHAVTSMGLSGQLSMPFRFGRGGPGGWVLMNEPELHIAGAVVVPDLAGWRRERMPVVPTKDAYIDIVPNWICEVLSPSTARFDRRIKMSTYALAGVDHLWLIDPDPQTLEAYERSPSGQWLLLATHGGDDVAAIKPFADAPLELALLWQL